MFKQAFWLFLIAAGAGAIRQSFPHGISWTGQWPTEETSAENAYRMMAQDGDPAFAALEEVIDLQSKDGATFLDARTNAEFKEGHIPGARSLPYYDLATFKASALEGLSPTSLIVVYCEGIGCELSFFLGRELVAGGFTNVRIFYGGYPEWSKAGLPVDKTS